jgi:hypothetical protein
MEQDRGPGEGLFEAPCLVGLDRITWRIRPRILAVLERAHRDPGVFGAPGVLGSRHEEGFDPERILQHGEEFGKFFSCRGATEDLELRPLEGLVLQGLDADGDDPLILTRGLGLGLILARRLAKLQGLESLPQETREPGGVSRGATAAEGEAPDIPALGLETDLEPQQASALDLEASEELQDEPMGNEEQGFQAIHRPGKGLAREVSPLASPFGKLGVGEGSTRDLPQPEPLGPEAGGHVGGRKAGESPEVSDAQLVEEEAEAWLRIQGLEWKGRERPRQLAGAQQPIRGAMTREDEAPAQIFSHHEARGVSQLAQPIPKLKEASTLRGEALLAIAPGFEGDGDRVGWERRHRGRHPKGLPGERLEILALFGRTPAFDQEIRAEGAGFREAHAHPEPKASRGGGEREDARGVA